MSKVVLVTGGSRGIGAAIVESFVEGGAKVYFTCRSLGSEVEDFLASLKKRGAAFCLSCDVRKKSEVENAVEELLQKEERIDVLVNNAGVIRDGLFLAMSDEDWSEVLETNLGGTYFFCKAVARPMIAQRGGRIINISSIVGELGGIGQANYAASKGAVNALTKSLAAELASRNITVNAVSPGMVNTRMSEAVRSAFGDRIKEKIPLGFFAEPKDVAGVVSFLASDSARYITGQIIAVDGGLSLLNRK
jgi:3-oxoacyl-[acyl-carrier protein] reductase